jgi:lipoprotein-anchoring transpeptidase ErfK/SrfK
VSRVVLVPVLVLLGVAASVTVLSARSRAERIAANDEAAAAPATSATPVANVSLAARRTRTAAAASRDALERRRRAASRVYGVVRVRRPLALRSRPRGPVVASTPSTTEFGSPGVAAVGARRGPWLGLVTSARPNNVLGWVKRDDPGVGLRRVAYSLHADLSERRLELRRRGRRVKRLSVAVGRPGSSTPTGRFAVTDKLSGGRFGPYYGCCILALNGKQPKLPPGWQGGNRLAIHGTDSPGTIGAAASAGCLRAADADLQVLMRRVPPGTPVFIRN